MGSQRATLQAIRRTSSGQRIGFCSGGFDFTHPGHVLFFEDCKKHCDVLVVGIGSDLVRMIYKHDLTRPIWNEQLRLKMVSSLKSVDYAFIIDPLSPDRHPLDELDEVFAVLRPDVYIINSEASDIPYRQAMVAKHGIVMVILERTCPPEFENISTTSIITKIQKLSLQEADGL